MLIKMVEKIKTGTTCIGLVYKNGLIMAADKRMSAGSMISSDQATKVFEITPKIFSTISGYAADCQLFMRIVTGEAKLLELKYEREIHINEVAMILNSMQYSALRSSGSVVSLILGGYDDKKGPVLYNLGPDGTMETDRFVLSDGSGSVFIKAILESEYKKGMSEKEAISLVEKGFLSSFKNDSGSGGGYIIKVIGPNGIKETISKEVKLDLNEVQEVN